MINLAIVEQALDSLSDAVERYDCMGWYDASYADDTQQAEANAVHAAQVALRDALKAAKLKAPKLWIFTQPYSDIEPFTGFVTARSEDAARRQVVDRWLAEGRLREPPAGDDRSAYLDEGGDGYLRVSGPFALAGIGAPVDNPRFRPPLPIDVIARCVATHVDLRLSVEELDHLSEDADGVVETWGDYARECVDDEERERYTKKAKAWERISQLAYKVRMDLDKRARKAGCK